MSLITSTKLKNNVKNSHASVDEAGPTTTKSTAATNQAADPNHRHLIEHVEIIVKDKIKNEFGIGLTKIVFSSHWLIKIFWSLFLLGSLAVSVYLIVKLFVDFYSYNVSTTQRQMFETPMQFPKVIVCNQNAITTEQGYVASLNLRFPTDLGLLNETTKRLLGHDISDLLVACTFSNLPCTADDFVWFFDRNLGNCWSFNSGQRDVDLLKSIRAGADYGLQMTLYSNFYENLTYING